METNAVYIQGIFGIGGENHGKIRVVVGAPEGELTADKIKPDEKGTVLVGGSLIIINALRRAEEVSVSCLLAGGIRYRNLTSFMGVEIGVAITGQEEVGITIILTEGFGKMKMANRTFDLFRALKAITRR